MKEKGDKLEIQTLQVKDLNHVTSWNSFSADSRENVAHSLLVDLVEVNSRKEARELVCDYLKAWNSLSMLQ